MLASEQSDVDAMRVIIIITIHSVAACILYDHVNITHIRCEEKCVCVHFENVFINCRLHYVCVASALFFTTFLPISQHPKGEDF